MEHAELELWTAGSAAAFRISRKRELRRYASDTEDSGRWKTRVMVDRYAKYATEHLAVAAARIENGKGGNVLQLSTFSLRRKEERASG
jgi:hypothetical protein